MANILVRDLPPAVHASLQRRAAREGKSLQQYLRGELIRIADRPTLDDVLHRVESRGPGTLSLEQAVESIRRERDGR